MKTRVRKATVQNVESVRVSAKFDSPTQLDEPPWKSAYLPVSCFYSDSVTILTSGHAATTARTSTTGVTSR